jgi:hypothetical protein
MKMRVKKGPREKTSPAKKNLPWQKKKKLRPHMPLSHYQTPSC